MTAIDIIIPVYNEELAVVEATIKDAKHAFQNQPFNMQLYIVNDGSDSKYGLNKLAERTDITYIEHPQNRGYGASLKTGILSSCADWIAITDADGTYPVADLPKLASHMNIHDMVIGTRTGKTRQIPVLRRLPKFYLNLFASYMTGKKIKDLNSGMRIFRRNLCYYLWGFFPDGFSFTSTITMGAHMNGFRVKEISIDYFKREGNSSIHPIKDTIRFFRLVSRLGLTFYPRKLFTPIAIILFSIGFIKGFFYDYLSLNHVGNFATLMMLSGLQIYMIGLIAKLIVHSRALPPTHPLEINTQEQYKPKTSVSTANQSTETHVD